MARHPAIHPTSVIAANATVASTDGTVGCGAAMQLAMFGDFDGDLDLVLRTSFKAWREFADGSRNREL